jgi:hypothetical protein
MAIHGRRESEAVWYFRNTIQALLIWNCSDIAGVESATITISLLEIVCSLDIDHLPLSQTKTKRLLGMNQPGRNLF